MKRRSPTLEGFRILFRVPSLGCAEIAWRWSFGLAVTALVALSFREYLSTLPVTAAEMFMLQTRQPALILQAMSQIVHGSAPRALVALTVLFLSLTLGWIVLASLGRAATLKTICEYFQDKEQSKAAGAKLGTLIGLNFLRAAALLAAVVSSIGAALVSGAASSKADPSPGTAMLIFWMLMLFVGLAWSIMNWLLSLASIFAVGGERNTLESLAAAVDLCHRRPGPVIAVATWFGIAHTIAFVIASTVVAFPLGFAELLPVGMVLGGVLLLMLMYFAVADFIYVGRMAAYLFLIQNEGQESLELLPGIQPLAPSDDDILSDIPGLVPPQPAAG